MGTQIPFGREVDRVVLPDEESVAAAKDDATNGTVGTLHELAEKHGGYVVYSDGGTSIQE